MRLLQGHISIIQLSFEWKKVENSYKYVKVLEANINNNMEHTKEVDIRVVYIVTQNYEHKNRSKCLRSEHKETWSVWDTTSDGVLDNVSIIRDFNWLYICLKHL